MLSLVDDCLGEISSRCDYLSQLMWASSCKPLTKYLPKSLIALDQLILQVIKADSVNLYQYYDVPRFLSLWNYLLSKESVLAYIGQHLSSNARKELFKRMDKESQLVVIEFAFSGCPFEEACYYRDTYTSEFAASFFLSLAVEQRYEKSFLDDDGPQMLIPYQKLYRNGTFESKNDYIWRFRHLSRPEEVRWDAYSIDRNDYISAMNEAITFLHNDYFIASYKALVKRVLSVTSSDFLNTAIKSGNLPIIKFLIDELPNRNSYRHRMIIPMEVLSLKMVDLCLPYLLPECHVTSRFYIPVFWSQDQKEAVLRLARLNFCMGSGILQALFGDVIIDGFGRPVPFRLSLSSVLYEICGILQDSSKLDLYLANATKLKQCLMRVLNEEAHPLIKILQGACYTSIVLLTSCEQKSDNLVLQRVLLFFEIVGDLEVLRGYLYRWRDDILRVLNTLHDESIKKIVMNSVLLKD